MAQTAIFEKSKWEIDEFGKSGFRAQMNFPNNLNEDFFLTSGENAMDSLIANLGQPDKFCITDGRVSLIWHFEGFKNSQYFNQDDFQGKECGEKFPFGNSFIVFIFSCDGRYISSTTIKEGG